MEMGLQISRPSYGGGSPEAKVWLRRWSSRFQHLVMEVGSRYQGLVMEVDLQMPRSGYGGEAPDSMVWLWRWGSRFQGLVMEGHLQMPRSGGGAPVSKAAKVHQCIPGLLIKNLNDIIVLPLLPEIALDS